MPSESEPLLRTLAPALREMERRMRGWLGDPVWRAVKFRTAADLRRLVEGAGLRVVAYAEPCTIRRAAWRHGFLPLSIYGLGRRQHSELHFWVCLRPRTGMN